MICLMYPPLCSLSFLLTIQLNVFHSHKSLDYLFKTVNEELSLVADWFCANRLTLNLEKTNFIIFKLHRKSMPLANQMSLVINGVPITQVITTKFLGVYVDQHLT